MRPRWRCASLVLVFDAGAVLPLVLTMIPFNDLLTRVLVKLL